MGFEMDGIERRGMSILFPGDSYEKCTPLSDVALHDLGLDTIAEHISEKSSEQCLVLSVMSRISGESALSEYRMDIFEDIYHNPDFRNRMLKILDKIDFLRDYGSFRRDSEEATGTWDLVHRLEEIRDYIGYVEALQDCLSDAQLKSKGLRDLKTHIDRIYHDSGFEELKKDIAALKATTSSLRSVTLGVNLNERFEAKEIGVISINSKEFSRSTILDNLTARISRRDMIAPDTEWDGTMRFSPFSTDKGNEDLVLGLATARAMMMNPVMMMSLAMVSERDMARDVTSHMDRVADHMLVQTSKKLKDVLSKYVGLSIMNITSLIPEFIYYVRWAEYIEKLEKNGLVFSKASLLAENQEGLRMRARGFYNLKLAAAMQKREETIVKNDLDFDRERNLYILTGANRGGKTTVTQAIGLLYLLAQGGIFVPAESFSFSPVDAIFTHYPADEDKTLDYGRLGEECRRFRDIFCQCTQESLLLLNETFSTTSFEEGFFIARDAVRALLKKGTRCIYNTHMHKLAADIDAMNSDSYWKASSLVALSDGEERSFKVKVAPPQGMSYAKDIADRYGVSYEKLMEKAH